MNPIIAQLAGDVLAGRLLDADQADTLARIDGDELYDLFYWANAVRTKHFGRSVTFCSIAAGKVGACSEDCRFCAQSARYATHVAAEPRATTDQLVEAARQGSAGGAKWFGIVNSGRAAGRADIDQVAAAVPRIAAAGLKDIAPCASLGCLTREQAVQLRQAGLTRYHHNIETSRRFFPQIVTTHTFDERIETLRNARSAGMEICSGGIFNLGETWADRIDMALTLRDLAVDMVPMNFLNPIPGTPLENRPAMAPLDVLKTITLFRLLMPTTSLKMAGGREVNLRELQSWMYYCGATSCMVGNYLTTCGRPGAVDRQLVADLGLTVGECPRS